MIVGVDNNYLGMLLHPSVKPPLNPNTQKPVTELRERLDALVDRWNKAAARVVVPMPALAEFLVLAGDEGNLYLSELNNLANVYLRPFDLRAAIELASMELNARQFGSKRGPVDQAVPWQKVKVDRQIVAIAKVAQVTTFFTDDKDAAALARSEGMIVVSSWELPIPPKPQSLFPTSREISLE